MESSRSRALKTVAQLAKLYESRHEKRLFDARVLWQSEQMPKAYRTDVVGHQKFQGEIGKSKSALKAQRVRCPTDGCECTYEMYGSQPSNHEGNVTILQERVKRECPDHTSEVLAVNQFRKVPR